MTGDSTFAFVFELNIRLYMVGSTDVWLHPRTAVGMLDFVNVVSLPAGVTEVPSGLDVHCPPRQFLLAYSSRWRTWICPHCPLRNRVR